MSTTDVNNTQEILVRLNELDLQIKERENIKQTLNEELKNRSQANSIFAEYYSRHTGLKSIPSVYANFPKFPLDKSHYEKHKAGAQKASKINKILIGVVVVFVILSFVADIFAGALVFVIMGSGIIWSNNKTKKEKYVKAKEEYDSSVNQYNTTYTAFKNALSLYPEEKEKGIQFASEYGQYYEKLQNEFMDKIEEYQQSLKSLELEINELTVNMSDKYNFISEKYYHLVPDIIDILNNHRADTYKEALNLAIADEKAQQRRLFEERVAYERQLCEEELARQKAIQIEEQRRHNLEMERNQAKANELAAQTQREADRQRKAEERQAYKTQLEAKNAASMRCTTCKNYHKGCRGGIINCGSYISNRV